VKIGKKLVGFPQGADTVRSRGKKTKLWRSKAKGPPRKNCCSNRKEAQKIVGPLRSELNNKLARGREGGGETSLRSNLGLSHTNGGME